MADIIHNKAYEPTLDEISASISGPARARWEALNRFLQEQYGAAPRRMYSICAGKPGWNVKYQKAGKALCTLYPEPDCFIALVVIAEALAPLLETAQPALHPSIVQMAKQNKPFNHTVWMMIPVADDAVLESVKDLLALKINFAKR